MFFNKQYKEASNFYRFTSLSFVIIVIALGLILVGYDWYVLAASNGESIATGVAMMILGANIALIFIFRKLF